FTAKARMKGFQKSPRPSPRDDETFAREIRRNKLMNAPVIRISIGKFDLDKTAVVESKLRDSKARLETGIRAMRGNLGYYVGIDHTNHAMHNVRVWHSVR